MNKNILYILLFAFVFSACEKDDICLLPTTPKLILRFYDTADPTEFKSVERLSVWAKEKDTLSSYISVTLDSIVIPLNPNTSQTIYNLKRNIVDGNDTTNEYNQLTINYTTEEIFVSRSCGFKTIYNNVTIVSDTGWIQSFTPTTLTTIDNETKAHVKIYH